MLGLFFLVVWVSVIAALTSTERRRSAHLLLMGSAEEEFQKALSKNDHGAIAQYYRHALNRGLPPLDEQLVRINLACAENGMGRHDRALDELDRVDLSLLLPTQVALWLNNRAYTLTLLGRSSDALEHLRDAEELLSGDDGLYRDPSLQACIFGTRGIALLHQGDYAQAEDALKLALKTEDEATLQRVDPTLLPSAARAAERLYWLAELEQRRENREAAQLYLRRAAAYSETEYGNRAAQALNPGQ